MRVLFIDIDTLRPDRMSCYGYSRITTPNIDEVAKDGVVFENYYCSDAPCLPSRASLVSGMFGLKNGAVGHGGTAADMTLCGEKRGFRNPEDMENLFFTFRQAGYYTASISTFAERHSSYWFNAGFNETYNVGGGGCESGEEVIPIALDWLEKNRDQDNWFLHLHIWDPHTPYRTPKEFGNPFDANNIESWISEKTFEEHLKHTGPHSANELNMFNDSKDPNYPRHPGKILSYKEMKKFQNEYDQSILYSDTLIGQVFDKLREYDIYSDTAIIITSDHGENMGELGLYGEHATADEPTCHIPMIIKWPDIMSGHRDSGFHYNIDLAPTVAELLDVKKSENWDGKSYKESLLKGVDTGRECLILSQLAHVCQRSARFEDWLYIRTYHDGYHLFEDEMLFNLKDDLYEQKNLKDQYPDICARGAKYILDWHDSLMKESGHQIDPLWTVISEGGPFHAMDTDFNAYLNRLENTGRSLGADALRNKYTDDGKLKFKK